jgi:hypothetical protein
VEKVANALNVEAAAGAADAVVNIVVLMDRSSSWCRSTKGTLGLGQYKMLRCMPVTTTTLHETKDVSALERWRDRDCGGVC